MSLEALVSVAALEKGVKVMGYAIRKMFRVYWRQIVATVSVSFAVMAPVVVGAMGMGLDVAQSRLIQERLSNALDSAALAGAAAATSEPDIRRKIEDFFDANYPFERLGVRFDPDVVVNGDEVQVNGNAQYNTRFLRLIGIETIDLDAETIVQRQVQGIEVALVMDNTGSMATNNNIGALRTAATNFVSILFDSTENPNFIRVGLVPYSTSVNVGSYGLGLDDEGRYYDTAFVNNPQDLDYRAGSSSQWGGCVLADDHPADTQDHEGPWDMYRYCRRGSDDFPTCDRFWSRSRGTFVALRSPNHICPRTSIVPLTNNRDLLETRINSMQASGHTLGNYGMVWGYRVVSPGYPFQEGAEWDSLFWKKAIVMMTDGVNTMHPNYSAYGRTVDHNVRPTQLNERFAEVCDNLKEEGVTIYTVTFTSGVSEATKDFYRDCASSNANYHDAPTQDDLINVFESISRELSNLHIRS